MYVLVIWFVICVFQETLQQMVPNHCRLFLELLSVIWFFLLLVYLLWNIEISEQYWNWDSIKPLKIILLRPKQKQPPVVFYKKKARNIHNTRNFVNKAKLLRTPILKNTCKRLLLSKERNLDLRNIALSFLLALEHNFEICSSKPRFLSIVTPNSFTSDFSHLMSFPVLAHIACLTQEINRWHLSESSFM